MAKVDNILTKEKILEMLRNFENSHLISIPFLLPILPRYRKPCKKEIPHTKAMGDFDDAKFEKDFNINNFINIPTDKEDFSACYVELSYIINRYLQNEASIPESPSPKKGEKILLAVYFIFAALYATDNILYPLDVLLQLYDNDIHYVFNNIISPQLSQQDNDRIDKFIKDIEPLLTWKNIHAFLDSTEECNTNSIIYKKLIFDADTYNPLLLKIKKNDYIDEAESTSYDSLALDFAKCLKLEHMTAKHFEKKLVYLTYKCS